MTTWNWPNFTPEEMACRGTGTVHMDPYFMDRLQELRSELGFPFIINSGYRTPEYDKSIGGAGVHPQGKAVDIGVYGTRAYEIIAAARRHGFTGIGIAQKGPRSSRFIHLDTLPVGGSHPRPWVWTY